ncbi:MAG: tRNA (adenosine(37)-N6)-dimethylallyltransferase MiaA [Hydrogenophaga sp.]|nr:tRNA (adenosine(37)-N6)-dimethylallyltransferase MiaA [Hydrogenophaga sp.]
MGPTRRGCIALAGPTASGKSAASLVIARRWPVEIISVDSALVYRGMDIGTAKPTPAERAEVPHHLIDIRDPLDAYSAAAFVSDASRLIGEIQARGRTPLLVGGTMLYFKALIQGMDDMPKADAGVRERIEAQARERGWPALHAALALVDPATAARLSPNDSQRIQRALEVYEVSGQPISTLQTGQAGVHDSPLAPDRLVSLEPQDRAWLHGRIAQRFDAMLADGLVGEVQRLRARGDLHIDLPSMRCVGYRQVWELLDAAGPGPLTPAQQALLRERGVAATRQLAKRQLTWLRSMPQRRVIACDAPDALDLVLESVRELMAA